MFDRKPNGRREWSYLGPILDSHTRIASRVYVLSKSKKTQFGSVAIVPYKPAQNFIGRERYGTADMR
jgi:hypothetical protein